MDKKSWLKGHLYHLSAVVLTCYLVPYALFFYKLSIYFSYLACLLVGLFLGIRLVYFIFRQDP